MQITMRDTLVPPTTPAGNPLGHLERQWVRERRSSDRGSVRMRAGADMLRLTAVGGPRIAATCKVQAASLEDPEIPKYEDNETTVANSRRALPRNWRRQRVDTAQFAGARDRDIFLQASARRLAPERLNSCATTSCRTCTSMSRRFPVRDPAPLKRPAKRNNAAIIIRRT